MVCICVKIQQNGKEIVDQKLISVKSHWHWGVKKLNLSYFLFLSVFLIQSFGASSKNWVNLSKFDNFGQLICAFTFEAYQNYNYEKTFALNFQFYIFGTFKFNDSLLLVSVRNVQKLFSVSVNIFIYFEK